MLNFPRNKHPVVLKEHELFHINYTVLKEQSTTWMITCNSFTTLPILTSPGQRKCGLFGVCCEAIPRQVNILIDEGVLTGKGANSAISYMHYFLERHRLGETFAQIHTDNCRAQNKNNAFMWYYLWRVLTEWHHTIQYNFLLAGHMKFAPDWCFGLVKQRTRKTFISSLFDIARAVKDSAIVNTAELVGLHNVTVLIPTYDWMSYLDTFFKKIPYLKTYHHFRFDKNKSGWTLTISLFISCGQPE